MPKYSATGVTASMLSGRLSSWFDLKGPSVTIDTACSSSLVALDQACRTLQLGKASMVSNWFHHMVIPLDLKDLTVTCLGRCRRLQPHIHR